MEPFFFYIHTHKEKKQFPALHNTQTHTMQKATTVGAAAEHDEGLMWVQPVIYEPTTRRAHAFCAAMLLFSSSSCSSAL
jgi:hypothetical protein